MTVWEAMQQRHSVRRYTDAPILPEALTALQQELEQCNGESGLHFQLVCNEPKAFDGFLAHYGNFSGVKNYIALVGKKGRQLDELCGYYGQRLVLLAQQLGLNTCWVALTYRKISGAFSICKGEKLAAVIALGYGETAGASHSGKSPEAVSNLTSESPAWFRDGVAAALLAPTAMNQQKFLLRLEGDRVSAQAGTGFYTKMDLGIVKYHFEQGSGKSRDIWK